MARPMKPKALKIITGSREPVLPAMELPSLKQCPPAPDWLPNAHSVKEWNRLAPLIAATGLLTEGGLATLGTLCALTGKLIQLWAAGETPTANMIGQYRSLSNDFGLTPAAQAKIRAPSVEPSGNRFAANGKRTA